MSSIKTLIEQLAPEGEQINPEEFSSLMLDDQKLERALNAEDKKYLEEFKNVEILSFSNTQIPTLANFPDIPELKRIELNSNGLTGDNLKHLLKYNLLHTIKFDDNKVSDYSELEAIKSLSICNLSLKGNPIAEKEDYREKLFEIFADLEVLDGMNKDGDEIQSVGEDDDYGEEGEDDLDGEEGEAEEIDEETLKKLREQGYDIADDEEEGEFQDDGEEGEDDDYGDEDYDDEEEEAGNGKLGKRGAQDDDSEEEPAKKRRK